MMTPCGASRSVNSQSSRPVYCRWLADLSEMAQLSVALEQEVKCLVALSPGRSEVTVKTTRGAEPQECLMLTFVRIDPCS